MALLSIKNDIHLSLSWGEATALVLLDLSAAFDTIDHSTRLSCLLDWFSVGGSTLKWFSSYLTECFQSVKIGSTLSNLQKLVFSMPQNSVLGPLLFSLYTSPLSTLIGKHKDVNFHSYADNTQLYVHLSHMNASAAFDKLNRCLQDFRNIRQFLTQDAAVLVANAFVSSRLDYFNSLFRSLPQFNLHRLQSIPKWCS